MVEDGPRGATRVSVDHGSVEDAVPVVGGDGEPVSVTDTFHARSLTVGRKVVNGLAGPFRFEVGCTLGSDNLTLTGGDAFFESSAGQTREVALPEGDDGASGSGASGPGFLARTGGAPLGALLGGLLMIVVGLGVLRLRHTAPPVR